MAHRSSGLVLSSVWVLLAATRITRGEEDAGRFDLLLAGRLRLVDVVRALHGRDRRGVAVVISAAVGAALVAAGTDTTGAVIYAAAILGRHPDLRHRRRIRGAGDADEVGGGRLHRRRYWVSGSAGANARRRRAALAWVAWTTPFGLTARAAPYADNRVTPLLVLAGFPSRSRWPG